VTVPQLAGSAPRRGWVLPLGVLLLVAVPIFEVWLLIQVGQQIGVLPTVAILLVEAVLGAWLMRREGTRAWKALNVAFGTGRMPAGELADAALVLVGGVLLMLPGFFTDVLGLLFLLPFTRPGAKRILGFLVARRLQRAGLSATPLVNRNDLIEGEVVGEETPQSGPGGPRVISGEVEEGPR
jgi:UPF0716 protein FxsA